MECSVAGDTCLVVCANCVTNERLERYTAQLQVRCHVLCLSCSRTCFHLFRITACTYGEPAVLIRNHKQWCSCCDRASSPWRKCFSNTIGLWIHQREPVFSIRIYR